MLIEKIRDGFWEFEKTPAPADEPATLVPTPQAGVSPSPHSQQAINHPQHNQGGYNGTSHQGHGHSHDNRSHWECGGSSHRGFYQQGGGGHFTGGHRADPHWIDNEEDFERAIQESIRFEQEKEKERELEKKIVPSQSPTPAQETPTKSVAKPTAAPPPEASAVSYNELYLPKEEAENIWTRLNADSDDVTYEEDSEECNIEAPPEDEDGIED